MIGPIQVMDLGVPSEAVIGRSSLSEVGGLLDAVEGYSAGRRGQRRCADRPAADGVAVVPTDPALLHRGAHLHADGQVDR